MSDHALEYDAPDLHSLTTTDDGQQFFLAIRRARNDPTVELTLCDGSRAWVGRLVDACLTPPKYGIDRDAFRQRILGALGACGASDSLCVKPARDGSVQILWSASLTVDAHLDIHVEMKQAIDLAPEPKPGVSLRTMLGQLTDGLHESERAITTQRERMRELRVRPARATPPTRAFVRTFDVPACPWRARRPRPRLPFAPSPLLSQEQQRELQRLEASYKAPLDGVRSELTSRCLRVLNQKKRRIRALEQRLTQWAEDGNSDTNSEGDADSESDADTPVSASGGAGSPPRKQQRGKPDPARATQPAPPAAVGAAEAASSNAPKPDSPTEEENLLDLL